MKLLVIHLSDIHFKHGTSNPVLDRATAIANAAHNAMPDAQHVLIAVTGDIAYGGLAEEYASAKSFLTLLTTQVRARNSQIRSLRIAIVPGNHDCFLSEDQSARDKVIRDLTREDLEKSSIQSLLAHPQRHFFSFAESDLNAEVLHPMRNPFFAYDLDIDGTAIQVFTANTALCTRIPEMPGSLQLPRIADSNPALPSFSPALSLILAHHPPHWLTPDSYHDLRDEVINRRAVLLTGHEHMPHLWSASSEDKLSHLIEGGVLQDPKSQATSTFHTLSIDSDSGDLLHRVHSWQQTVFVSSEPVPLAWNRPSVGSRAVRLSLHEAFHHYLEDPGSLLAHPRKAAIKLGDLFVMPDLRAHADVLKRDQTKKIVRATAVIDRLVAEQTSLISAGPRAGKTSLSKRVFLELWRRGDLPLLVRGEDLRKQGNTTLRDKISKAITQNYRVNHPDEFLNSNHKLVLIVDDFSSCGKTRRHQDLILGELKAIFSSVVLFDRNPIDVDDFVFQGHVLDHLRTLAQFDILPLGHAGREELVGKWVMLGTSPADDEDDLAAEVIETARTVETLLGRDLIPPSPFYVVSLLAALQQGPQPTADLGSLGYLYELLIKASLAKAVRQPELMQTYDRFLANLAYSLYQQQGRSATRAEFRDRCTEYAGRHLIDFDATSAEDVLTRASILATDGQNIYFRYKYTFYFFVAKYLSQRLSTSQGQEEVQKLTRELYRTDASNVLLFLCHCTSDPLIVNSVIGAASKLFDGYPETNLVKDSAFLNTLSQTVPPLALGASSPIENRKRLLSEKDQQDEATRLNSESNRPINALASEEAEEEADSKEHSDKLAAFNKQFTSSIKTLEIVGQILRNHPTIEGTDKIRLMKECASLTRRMLSSLLADMAEGAKVMINAVEEAILKKHPNIDPGKARMLSSTLFELHIESIAVSIISAYSRYLGVPSLEPVYKRVLADVPDETMQVLDLALKVENPRAFPEDEAMKAARSFKENGFVWNCVKALVFMYFYLYNTSDFKRKQRVCQRFGIDYQSPEILSDRTKRLV